MLQSLTCRAGGPGVGGGGLLRHGVGERGAARGGGGGRGRGPRGARGRRRGGPRAREVQLVGAVREVALEANAFIYYKKFS